LFEIGRGVVEHLEHLKASTVIGLIDKVPRAVRNNVLIVINGGRGTIIIGKFCGIGQIGHIQNQGSRVMTNTIFIQFIAKDKILVIGG